ncbi:MAG: hypothetical protein GC179_06910 [Anaerolineaceae bacterium]|nr:hypothetical protein [Anaerolineaceae bacterium]
MANGLNQLHARFASISAAGAFGGRSGSRPREWRHSSAATPMRRTQAAASSPPAHEEPAHLAGLLRGGGMCAQRTGLALVAFRCSASTLQRHGAAMRDLSDTLTSGLSSYGFRVGRHPRFRFV